jgi:hypothetical protein
MRKLTVLICACVMMIAVGIVIKIHHQSTSVAQVDRALGDFPTVVKHQTPTRDYYWDIQAEGRSWRVYLIACKTDTCNRLSLQALFEPKQHGNELLRNIDAWNAGSHFARAYTATDGTGVYLADDILLTYTSEKHIAEVVKIWLNEMDEFSDQVQ